jgi:hypothetical protein
VGGRFTPCAPPSGIGGAHRTRIPARPYSLTTNEAEWRKTKTMKNRTITLTAFLAAALMLGPLAKPTDAQVRFYTDLASFQAASTTSVAVTFEGFTPTNTNIFIPPEDPITLGGITFTPFEPTVSPNLVVATAGQALFTAPPESNVLTVSGNENIDMDFSTGPTAVGFDTYTNPFNPPVVKVYGTQGNLLATYILTQAPSTKGFLGITSTVPIGKVNWLADRGGIRNTGIDNVRTGAIRPHTLTFYLHGYDIPGTAGGFTMNQNPAPTHLLNINLLSAPRWYSQPALNGTFLSGATFTLTFRSTVGLNLATTFRLSATNPDGSGEQVLGQTTQGLGIGFGQRTVQIPVSTPVTLSNKRLKLTIFSAAGLNLNLQMGSSTYLRATNFVGTP